VYGLVIGDFFIAGPNIASTLLGIIQIAVRVLYPAKVEMDESPNEEEKMIQSGNDSEDIAI
jgi:hypothetical protein